MLDVANVRVRFESTDLLDLAGIAFSADEREAYLAGGPRGQTPTLYHATYDPESDTLGAPAQLLDESGVAITGADPALSPDGLSLYYTHLGGAAPAIWVATRSTVTAPFRAGVEVGIPGVNSSAGDGDPFVSCDGATLYFDSKRDGSLDELYSVSLVDSSPPVPIFTDAQTWADIGLFVSNDELTLYFGSDRDGPTKSDIFIAHRDAKHDRFGLPDSVYKSNYVDYPDAISNDGCTLWFTSTANYDAPASVYSMRKRSP